MKTGGIKPGMVAAGMGLMMVIVVKTLGIVVGPWLVVVVVMGRSGGPAATQPRGR
jgi:hypothetical protein